MAKRDFFRQREKKHYTRKRFANPHTRLPERKPLLAGIIITLGVIFCVLLVVYVLKSPRFSITEVAFEGFDSEDPTPAEIATRAYIEEPVLGIFLRGNRFLFSESEAKRITEEAVRSSVSNIRREDSRMIITVKEEDPAFLWTTEEGVFVGRSNGTVERALTEEERSNVFGPSSFLINPAPEQINEVTGETESVTEIDPAILRSEKAISKLKEALMIRDLSNAPVAINDQIISAEAYNDLMIFHKLLKGAELDFGTIEIDPSLGDWASTSVHSEKGSHKLIFSLNENPQRQFENYLSIIQNKQLNESIRQYVDVRFKDHVYLK